jgi:hypothetical protein
VHGAWRKVHDAWRVVQGTSFNKDLIKKSKSKGSFTSISH